MHKIHNHFWSDIQCYKHVLVLLVRVTIHSSTTARWCIEILNNLLKTYICTYGCTTPSLCLGTLVSKQKDMLRGCPDLFHAVHYLSWNHTIDGGSRPPPVMYISRTSTSDCVWCPTIAHSISLDTKMVLRTEIQCSMWEKILTISIQPLYCVALTAAVGLCFRRVHLRWCARVSTTLERLWHQGQVASFLAVPLL